MRIVPRYARVNGASYMSASYAADRMLGINRAALNRIVRLVKRERPFDTALHEAIKIELEKTQ